MVTASPIKSMVLGGTRYGSPRAHATTLTTRLIASVALASVLGLGCSEDQPSPQPEAAWTKVFDDLDATLFSVWGTGSDDIWTVGADDGEGPLVLHFDGDSWQRRATETAGNLWWVSGVGETIWMSGDGGTILRYSRDSEQFEAMQAPESVTVYGILPFADDDVWAVGGDVDQSLAYVFHFDGQDWTTVTDLPDDAASDAWFKVWGTSSNDLWVVGFSESALHHSGDTWSRVSVPTGNRLFTVHGHDDLTVAVGGSVSALIVESNESADFVNVTPKPEPLQLNGVWVNPDGTALAAGDAASIWQRDMQGGWTEVVEPESLLDYHAVFVDPDGDAWAVGGKIITEPFNQGILGHRGAEISNQLD